jgi:hypothetical protein
MSRFFDFIKATKYNIGFVDGSLESVIHGEPIKVNWMKHPYKDRWFADPFILDITDNDFIVLVEEWYDPIQRGRITKLIVDRNTFELKGMKVMLDEGSHLSFPAITRMDNEIYIQPESSATDQLVEYKYHPETDSLEKCSIISDQPLTDSVRTTFFGEDLLFSTKLPDANGKELGIYLWDEVQNKYCIRERYHFSENISRMAGNFFTCNGRIYRPAQVCIKSYGDAVSLQEVSNENGKWDFKEIRRVYSPSKDFDLGFHTFNEYKGVVVVDGLGYRMPRLSRFLRGIKNMVKNKRMV